VEAHEWGPRPLMQARVDEVLRPLELTFVRYELLMLLYCSRHGSLPIQKASLRLQVHHTTVTNAVDRLEAAGLVRRAPHPFDGRCVRCTSLRRAGDRSRGDCAPERLGILAAGSAFATSNRSTVSAH